MESRPLASKVRKQCPKCGFKYAFRVEATLILSFGDENEDEMKTPAWVFKCARCGYTWAEFSENEEGIEDEKNGENENFT